MNNTNVMLLYTYFTFQFVGWGGEDDELFKRTVKVNQHLYTWSTSETLNFNNLFLCRQN